MRNTAFLTLGFLLLVLESNLYRLVDTIHVAGPTPSLLLPLVVFMGVHEYSIARGAALSFVLGYLLDLFAGAPVGLFTFVSVATFLVARMAGVRLSAQTLLTKFALAFVFALLEGVLLVTLSAIFGGDPHRPRSLALLVPGYAVLTAACAPLVFHVAERVHLATIPTAVPQDGGRA
jgi:rod shape-determining protein MreD